MVRSISPAPTTALRSAGRSAGLVDPIVPSTSHCAKQPFGGDEQAAWRVHALTTAPPDKNAARAVISLCNVLRPILATASAPGAFQDNAAAIRDRLYDAIESTFGDRIAA